MSEPTGLNTVALADAGWRTSSYTAGNGNCVEVADGIPGIIPVRDTKTRTGPTLVIPTRAWNTFIACVKANDLLPA
ncbi:DUF397 domain-containing protein [Streptomyces sp. NBC_01803]|uniref:DUF397 domain-containing protein n=1 Tax=Streptomyces sp. NBC_01803 TaxID=2975946 RepID=UPI002DD93169|nr:DUF397 domain-containing protein [Streptomyces sp. NBC_01803]WSA43230.1 DUF397 domain-containing protein [Streptomyces sp. NBC_01803]